MILRKHLVKLLSLNFKTTFNKIDRRKIEESLNKLFVAKTLKILPLDEK